MRTLRIAYRTPIILFLILAYILMSLFWRIWTQDLAQRRRLYAATVSLYCGLALKVLGVHVTVKNDPGKDRSFFIVSNHLGLLDIFVLSSIHPTLFITSVEMRSTPGLGFLTEIGGCLYVERRHRQQILHEIENIRTALKQKLSVALYPEGTSSNGEKVLPFKKSLLVAAAGTDIPILPSVINFRRVDGEEISHKWRDYVCWYGDHPFSDYALRILGNKSVDVEVEFFETMQVHSEEQRREIAHQLQHLIESKFTPIPLRVQS